MHRHARNIPGGMSAQQKRCTAYSLNVVPTFVKCALGLVPLAPPRSPSIAEWARWVPSRRPPLARTQLQPISRKREQNNSYRGANAARRNESERDDGRGNARGPKGAPRQRGKGREKENEIKTRTFILRHPGRCPLSVFPLPFPPLAPLASRP